MSNNEAVTGETSIINEEHAARAAIAEAVARRAANASHDDDEERRFAMERDKRQLFRRLVDPGIARHTQPVVFEAAVKVYPNQFVVVSHEPHTHPRCYQPLRITYSRILKWKNIDGSSRPTLSSRSIWWR